MLSLTLVDAVKQAEDIGTGREQIQKDVIAFLGELSTQGIITPRTLAEALASACRIRSQDRRVPPDPDTYNRFLARGKDFAINVLSPGGMCASKGRTVTAQLKKFMLVMADTDELNNISVAQWEMIFGSLDNAAKAGNANAVEFVRGVLVSSEQ